jgi:voltage-gated potassium channel
MARSFSMFGGGVGMSGFAGPVLRFARTLGRAWNRSGDFRVLVYLVVLLLLGGTVFYSIAEGWSLLDSFYFSATTLTTVGFGDLAPQTALGKLATVLYLFVGLGIIGGSSTRWPRSPGARGAGDKAVGRAKKTLHREAGGPTKEGRSLGLRV